MSTSTITIVNKAGQLFYKYGIKSVTMDDIAREAGISKKTLYQFITDKNQIVQSFLTNKYDEFRESLNVIEESSVNTIIGMFKISEILADYIKKYSPAFVYDLRKYYVELYEEWIKNYHLLFENAIVNNIHKGKAELLYRDDVDEKMIAKLITSLFEDIPRSDHFTQEEYFSDDFPLKTCSYHIRGIATKKGIRLLEDYLTQIESN